MKETGERSLWYWRRGIIVMGALAWNEVIKMVIEKYLPNGGKTLMFKVVYAMILTFFIVVILKFI